MRCGGAFGKCDLDKGHKKCKDKNDILISGSMASSKYLNVQGQPFSRGKNSVINSLDPIRPILYIPPHFLDLKLHFLQRLQHIALPIVRDLRHQWPHPRRLLRIHKAAILKMKTNPADIGEVHVRQEVGFQFVPHGCEAVAAFVVSADGFHVWRDRSGELKGRHRV